MSWQPVVNVIACDGFTVTSSDCTSMLFLSNDIFVSKLVAHYLPTYPRQWYIENKIITNASHLSISTIFSCNNACANSNSNVTLQFMSINITYETHIFFIVVNILFFSPAVTMESTTILGAIFGLVALMLVFFLYINRKWCFNSTPGFPCCDETSLPSKYVHKMGKYLFACENFDAKLK